MHVVGGAAGSELRLEIIVALLGMPVVAATGGEAAYCDAGRTGRARPRQDDLAGWSRLQTASAASSRT